MLLLSTSLGAPGFLANLWVVASVLKSRIIRNHTSYMFIVSLAVSDMCSLISRPFMVTVALLVGPTFQSHWITDVGTLWVWFTCQYHFLVMAINRYCSVVYYDRYQRWFNRSNCLALVALCWAASFIVAFPLLVGEIKYGLLVGKYTYLYTGTYKNTGTFAKFSLSCSCINVALLIYLYSGVILGIRKKSRTFVKPDGKDTAGDGSGGGGKGSGGGVGIKKQEISLAIQFIIITFIYAMMNMFFFITLGLSAAGIRSPIITMVNNTAITLNFACNPLVYLTFNKTLRRHMLTMCCPGLVAAALGGQTTGSMGGAGAGSSSVVVANARANPHEGTRVTAVAATSRP